MGVRIGEATGESVAVLECPGCGRTFETDETMLNTCPNCDVLSNDIVTTDPEMGWRDDVVYFTVSSSLYHESEACAGRSGRVKKCCRLRAKNVKDPCGNCVT